MSSVGTPVGALRPAVFGALVPESAAAIIAATRTVPLLAISVCLWAAAFGHFVLRYGSAPFGPGYAERIANDRRVWWKVR